MRSYPKKYNRKRKYRIRKTVYQPTKRGLCIYRLIMILRGKPNSACILERLTNYSGKDYIIILP